MNEVTQDAVADASSTNAQLTGNGNIGKAGHTQQELTVADSQADVDSEPRVTSGFQSESPEGRVPSRVNDYSVEETVRRLISVYLRKPTHVSSFSRCW